MQKIHSEAFALTFNCAENNFLQSLMQTIEDNMDAPSFSVGWLAQNMAISKSTLNRKLSALLGLSANEIIRHCRLKKAAHFLLSGKNVSETAYLTGFETPSYFIQCFRQFYQVTPKTYSKTNNQPLLS